MLGTRREIWSLDSSREACRLKLMVEVGICVEGWDGAGAVSELQGLVCQVWSVESLEYFKEVT